FKIDSHRISSSVFQRNMHIIRLNKYRFVELIIPLPDTPIQQENLSCPVDKRGFFDGGEEETRTPAPVSRPTPLAGT
ncbi:MAG: hypothetical protein IK104_01365, partial [Clostridia bacterium]|nr:hypothetical protein [Clostridia bacterium]